MRMDRRIARLLFGGIMLTGLFSCKDKTTESKRESDTDLIFDHNSVNISAIPGNAIAQAASLRLLVRRASAGGHISSGLDSLYNDNSVYNRSNWEFYNRGNPGWEDKISDLVSAVVANEGSYDVFTMKFCYIDPDAEFHKYRDSLLYLENRFPAKKFIWWTIPIETSGNTNRQAFNDSVRAYAASNNKILFDIADIECHDAAGQKLTDWRNRELLRNEWTDDGGHLNSDGARRVASAFWNLMARVGGWNGM
jgi:hypothetical protein